MTKIVLGGVRLSWGLLVLYLLAVLAAATAGAGVAVHHRALLWIGAAAFVVLFVVINLMRLRYQRLTRAGS
jgi:hypothetical protein